MKSNSAASEYIDPNLELGLIAAVAADPDLYWAVMDWVPDAAFAVERALWQQVAQAIRTQTKPPPVIRKASKGGVQMEEPVPPVPDPEAAARKLVDLSQRRLLAGLLQDQLLALRSGEPAETLIAKTESKLTAVSQSVRETRAGALAWANDIVPGVIAEAQAAKKRKDETGSTISGLSTGFKTLDSILNGLNEGLYILAAPPGYGKTSLSLQIAFNAAKDVPVVYITYENSPSNLVLKSLCRLAGLKTTDVERGIANLDGLTKGTDLFGVVAPRIAFLEGNARTTAAMVQGRALQAMYRHEANRCLVVIDYVQKMAPQLGQKSLRENVGILSTQLREMCRRLESPVLAISSLSREGYQRGTSNPYIETLKESGDLEYSADVVMFICEGKDDPCTPEAKNCQIKVLKNRYGPSDAEAFFTFIPAKGEFIIDLFEGQQ